MKTKLLKLMAVAGLIAVTAAIEAQTISDFENITLSANSYLNGSGPSVKSSITSGDAVLPNTYSTGYGGYWAGGFIYSSKTDSVTAGSSNMYSARSAKGYKGSSNYAVGQNYSRIKLSGDSKGKTVKGMYVTNSTYAALSMQKGDAFAKKFGGQTGNDPDYFMLIIKGYLNGTVTNDSVKFYLADYRSSTASEDYILKDWQWVDLTSLGALDSLQFNLASSDVGTYGMNTPAFFCMDDLVTFGDTADFENLNLGANKYWKGKSVTLQNNFISGNASYGCSYSVSEYGDYWSGGFAVTNKKDSTTAAYTNLYSAATAIGYNGSANYSTGQGNAIIKLTGNALQKMVSGFYVTNATYAALSMKNGDAFAKKFGGVSGNDPDWFKLTVRKYSGGVMTNDSVEFYLADFRFANNSQDYILKKWAWVDLKSLGNVDSLVFKLSSSDTGPYGMNTPSFFSMDNFTTEDTPLLVSELNNTNPIGLFPNPANSSINVNLADLQSEGALVQIIDGTGRLVYSEVTNSVSLQIPVAQLTNGIYYLNVSGNHFQKSKAFIKQ